MKRTAFLHNGSFPQLATLADPAIKALGLIDAYAPDLRESDLDGVDSIYLAARTHPSMLAKVAPMIVSFLEREGTKVYVDGINEVGTWLPGTDEVVRGTNFWSWRTGEDVGRRSINTDNQFWSEAGLNDYALHWHYHGVLSHPEQAVPVLRLEQVDGFEQESDLWGLNYRALPDHQNTLMYVDKYSWAGDVVVSTMDASYHHGAGFMPGATQLLYKMVHWLRA